MICTSSTLLLSTWKSQDLTVFTKVHYCKFSISLKFLDSVYFCIIRLFLAISQYCKEHSLKNLDDAWKNYITGNSGGVCIFLFPHWLVHLAVAENSFHKTLCIAARGKNTSLFSSHLKWRHGLLWKEREMLLLRRASTEWYIIFKQEVRKSVT